MRRSILLALVAVFLVFAGSLSAQQRECRQRSIPISVSSASGNLPVQLTSAHFLATYQDKSIRVTSISPEMRPQRLIVLLDASGSIRGGTTAGWAATVEAAAQLLAAMPPIEIAIALFAESVEPIIGPTSTHDRLVEEIENLRSGPQEEG